MRRAWPQPSAGLQRFKPFGFVAMDIKVLHMVDSA